MADPLVLLELLAPDRLDEDLVGLDVELRLSGSTGRPTLLRQLRRNQVDLENLELAAGTLPFIREVLGQLGRPVPKPLDYLSAPPELLGRAVWQTTLGAVRGHWEREQIPVFVKPADATKRFVGRVIRSESDLYHLATVSASTSVWCAELVTFTAEFRVFVVDREIVGVRQYEGTETVVPEAVAQRFATGLGERLPAGCAIDIGLLNDGRAVLVEVNDGFALGRYGLDPGSYLRLLRARWKQLVAGEHT